MASHRILVVDHDKDAADSLAGLLSAMGQETRAVYELDHATLLAAEFCPHLVIVELVAPEGHVLQAVKRLRDVAKQPVFVAALTHPSHPSSASKILSKGLDSCLFKPLDPAALLTLIAITQEFRSR